MNGYNFSQDVREALAQARREAGEWRHHYVGTEHVLLGIIANPESFGGALLKLHGVGSGQVRDRIASIVRLGTGPRRDDLHYTSRAKRILELAMSQARELDHDEVNTGHLFLGVIREEKGIGAGVLAESEARGAAVALRSMLESPRVADVFARHGVDAEAVIRDLLADEQTS